MVGLETGQTGLGTVILGVLRAGPETQIWLFHPPPPVGRHICRTRGYKGGSEIANVDHQNLVLEKKTVDWDRCRQAFKKGLEAFMAFNGCRNVEILQTDPVAIKQQLTWPT